jgi:hypothetical protein
VLVDARVARSHGARSHVVASKYKIKLKTGARI